MKMFSIGNHLTRYLLLTCVLLASILAIESHNLVQTDVGNPAETQAAVNPVERADFTAPAIAAFSEITERPLFNEGREPPPESAKTAMGAPVSKLRLHLEGVAITPEAKIAVVRDLKKNKMLHLTTGMEHQGWELTSVTDTVATFKRGEQSHKLTLKNLPKLK